MASSLCGESIGSRRALLAALWSLVTILTAIAFLTALTFTLSAKNVYNNNDDYYNNNNNNNNNNEQHAEDQEMDPEVAVTSRAMAFAALWTAVLASLLNVFGTVVLGWQSPTGQYYTCCSSNVHRTTPLSLGSFIGALIMFANLTLVCSVLFGEFEVRHDTRSCAVQASS
jgi:1,4-dihydroxy-2-naphthoate octaprenyltransferase